MAKQGPEGFTPAPATASEAMPAIDWSVIKPTTESSSPSEEQSDARFGDRVGETTANVINSVADRMIGAKEQLIGGAQAVRELGSSALSAVGSFADRATTRVVDGLQAAGQRFEDSAIESGHRRREKRALRAERRDAKVSFRDKMAGLREIGEATDGMGRSEKAQFALDLTKLEQAERHNVADNNANAAADRGQARMDERSRRLGRRVSGSSLENQAKAQDTVIDKADQEATVANWRQREAKMVADARAAEKTLKFEGKLAKANAKEAKAEARADKRQARADAREARRANRVEAREARIQARADAKARRQERRQAWADKARAKVSEVVDSAKAKAETAKNASKAVAKGAGKVALGVVSAPVILGAAGAREVYDLSRDIASGVADSARNAADKVKAAAANTNDRYHSRAGDRHRRKAEKATMKANRHYDKSESTEYGEVVTYSKVETND